MATHAPAELHNLWSMDRQLQNQAFRTILAATDRPVTWAYEAWDEQLENLSHQDNHNRAIAAQVLCNLAKSDPEGRMLRDFERLLAVTRDERFVTARHCLQALWKVGAAGPEHKEAAAGGAGAPFPRVFGGEELQLSPLRHLPEPAQCVRRGGGRGGQGQGAGADRDRARPEVSQEIRGRLERRVRRADRPPEGGVSRT